METRKVAEMNLPMHFAIRNVTLHDLQRDLLLLHSVLTRSNFRLSDKIPNKRHVFILERQNRWGRYRARRLTMEFSVNNSSTVI